MILIVDDYKYAGIILQTLCENAGSQAVWAMGGAEAIAIVRTQKPSLMILDMDMPLMDGFAVLRTIRGDPTLQGFPIVMYSANTDSTAADEAKRLGAVDFIVKGMVAPYKLVARFQELASADCAVGDSC